MTYQAQELCYVATDFESEPILVPVAIDKNYEHPVITVGSECFWWPETLFKPELTGVQSPGIHQLIFDSIMKSDPEHDVPRDCTMPQEGAHEASLKRTNEEKGPSIASSIE